MRQTCSLMYNMTFWCLAKGYFLRLSLLGLFHDHGTVCVLVPTPVFELFEAFRTQKIGVRLEPKIRFSPAAL